MIIPQAKKLNNVKEYYFSSKLQEIAKMQGEGIDVLNLAIGNPDMPPSETTIKALSESAANPSHHGYQSYRAIPELRQAIARWYKRIYNVDLNWENEVLPLIGSKEGIMHISMAFVNPQDEVLVPNPGYPAYNAVSNLAGAKVVEYSLDERRNWAIDLDRLKDIDLTEVKIMWINYPNMPTGAKPTDYLFESLIQLAHNNRFLLCNDNPYSLILNDRPKSILSYDGAEEVALELNSMSKSHSMAGWRQGWVCGGSDYINMILKFKSNMDSGMFLPLQHAAIEAFNNSDEWHDQQNVEYANRRKYLWEIFDLLGFQYNKDQAGLFVWAKAPYSIPNVTEYMETVLNEARVFIAPGFIFGTNGNRFVRASLCSTSDVYEEAIERIKQFVSK